jgi:hypothetical protein
MKVSNRSMNVENLEIIAHAVVTGYFSSRVRACAQVDLLQGSVDDYRRSASLKLNLDNEGEI